MRKFVFVLICLSFIFGVFFLLDKGFSAGEEIKILEKKGYSLGESVKFNMNGFKDYKLRIEGAGKNYLKAGKGGFFIFTPDSEGVYKVFLEYSGNIEEINFVVGEFKEISSEEKNLGSSEIELETGEYGAILGVDVERKRVISANSGERFEFPERAFDFSVLKNGEKTEEFVFDEFENKKELGFLEQGEFEVLYKLPAPISKEQEASTGKIVRVISEEHYENVLVYSDLSESFQIADSSRVRIYWKEGEKYLPVKSLQDRDGNGIYDYVEWVAPHLSEQTFEIIVIVEAEHLDRERNFLQDIYQEVRYLDGIFSPTISHEEYVRVAFQIPLSSSRDITIFPRIISGNPRIEVYEINKTEKIAEFVNLKDEEYNKVFLSGLEGVQDRFDLRVFDGEVQFDHIIDPYGINVQRGVETMTATQLNVTINQVNTSRAFVLVSTYSGSGTANILHVTADLFNGTILTLEKFSTTSTTVAWQVIEDISLSVERGITTTSGTGTSSIDIDLSRSYDLNKSFVIVSARTNTGTANQQARGHWTGVFANATRITLERGSTGTLSTVAWQVVEWDGVSVQSGTGTSSTTSTADLSMAVNLSQSFIYSTKRSGAGNNQGSSLMARTYFINASRIALHAEASAATTTVAYFVISSDKFLTQNNYLSFSATGQQNVSITSLNRSSGFSFSSNSYSGENNNYERAFVTNRLTADNVLTLEKGSGTTAVNSSWFVVELLGDIKPPNVSIISPLNITYGSPAFPLNVNVSLSEQGSAVLYSLNNGVTNFSLTSSNQINWSTTIASLSEGGYTLRIYANDTSGNRNDSQTVSFSVDLTAPNVSVNSPVQNFYYSSLPIRFNISTTENSTANYSLNGGANNFSMQANSSGTGFNASNSTLSDGNYTVRFYVADIYGNANNSVNVSFILDTTNPLISFTTGTENNNTNFSRDWIFANLSITEINFANLTFYLYNETDLVSENFFDDSTREINWSSLPDGVYYYNATTFDLAGNSNFTETRLIRLDMTPPVIVIEKPQPILYGYNESLPLNVTVYDEFLGLSACWWRLNNGANQSITCGQNTTFDALEGSNVIHYYANDSVGNLNYQNVTFFISLGAPSIALETPADNSYLNYKNNIQFNYTPIQENGIASCRLYGTWNGGWHLNQSNFSISEGATNSFIVNLIGENDGEYIWNVWCNSSLGNGAFSLNNHTFTLDTTNPLISFTTGTENNNTNFSRDWIFANLSITEINFANLTFYLYNETDLVSENFFDDSTREINWSSLSDGVYYYNATTFDLAGNSNFTEIRLIRLDITLPYVEILHPTNQNYTINVLDFNFSAIDVNLHSCWFSNDSGISNYSLPSCANTSYTAQQGNNNLILYANDSFGNLNFTEVSFFVDSISPLISFTTGTESNNTEFERQWIFSNVSVIETNFANITFSLYNSSGLVNQTTYYTENFEINWTGLSNNNLTYYYNVSTVDIFGNLNFTETRQIKLFDNTAPFVQIISPENISYDYNESLALNFNVNDLNLHSCWYNLNGGANVSLPLCENTTFSVADGGYTLNLYANDSVGNLNFSSVIFIANSSLIFTPDYYVERGNFSMTSTSEDVILSRKFDASKSFIMVSTRSASHTPNILQVTATFVNSTAIRFEKHSTTATTVEWEVITGPDLYVQRGETTTSGTGTSTIDIDFSLVNLSRSFIIITNRINSTTAGQNVRGFWSAQFTNATRFQVVRGVTGTLATVSWQVVDWNGSTVQSGLNTATTTPATVDLSTAFDLERSFIYTTKRSTTTNSVHTMAQSYFVNSTRIALLREGTTGTTTVGWFVISHPRLSVQTNYLSFSANTAQNIAINEVNSSKSFSVSSESSNTASTNYGQVFMTRSLSNDTNLDLQKGAATTTINSTWFVVEIVERENPVVNLIYPENNSNFSTHLISYFNFSVFDNSSITNCSLYGTWNGGWHLNQTINSPSNNQSVVQNFSQKNVSSSNYYNWNVVCIDKYGNVGTNSTNFTFAAFLFPNSPSLFNISQTNNNGTGNITLFWNSSEHSATYRIYYTNSLSQEFTLLNETTSLNYTDSNFSGNIRRFYRVDNWNPTGQNASLNYFGAHVNTLSHNINTRNWIGFPTNASYLVNANSSLNEITGATAFSIWNESLQIRTTCNSFSCPNYPSCTETNCNFFIGSGRGYEVNINNSLPSSYNWSYVGIVYPPANISLVKNATSFGKNWVSIYANTSLVNANNLLTNITYADTVTSWNAQTQTSQGYLKLGPIFLGTNFPIVMEKGYEVSVTNNSYWLQM